MLKPEDFFDLTCCPYRDLFDGIDTVWQALPRIPEYCQANLRPGIHGEVSRLAEVDENVSIGAGSVVEAGVVIHGPAIIGENCVIRQGAYLRGNVLIGDGVVVGHVTEVKNSLLNNEAQAPHFAYVGDSILGWRAHLGAGVKLSNFKVNRTPVVVTIDGEHYETGLRKFGAILGDEVEIGCNSVLNPGTLIGPRTLAYANLSLSGYFPPDLIVKLRQEHVIVERRKK